MSDFEYIPEDVSLVKASKFNLEKADRSGFIYGTAIGVPAGILLGKPLFGGLNRGFVRILFPLFTGSLMYEN